MLKYIRDVSGQIVIFSQAIEHKTICDNLKMTPKSAGFFLSSEGYSLAYGKSSTLDIGALPEDVDLIKQQMWA